MPRRSSNRRSAWSTTGTRRSERRRNSVKGALLLAVGLIAATTIGAYPIVTASARTLDADLCSPGTAPTTDAVIFVDPTSERTPAQRRTIEAEILRRAMALEKGDRITIYGLTSDSGPSVPQLMYSRCNPGDGADDSGLTTNVELSRERYAEEFLAPLAEAVKTVLDAGPSTSSPLLEALHRIIVEGFTPGSVRRDLVVFSDLLEKSDVMSQYSTGYSFEDVEHSAYVGEVGGQLLGTEVVVYRLTDRHAQRFQTDANLDFWTQYFSSTGVAAERVFRGL